MFIYNYLCYEQPVDLKAGTVTSGEDRFMEWKTKDGTMKTHSMLSLNFL